MYDAIVIGTRVAGAPTAMLLARRGLKVLAVDRARFPSDTLSTHQVQVPGVARLARWGLLERVDAAGTPATRRVRFDPGPVVLEGRCPEFEGVDALYSPRRTLLDTLLVDAAREAGAEVRERLRGRRAPVRRTAASSGVRSGAVRERARVVIGADGRHSLVAKAVRAAAYHALPARSIAYYTYWAGVPLDGGEMYARDRAHDRRVADERRAGDDLRRRARRRVRARSAPIPRAACCARSTCAGDLGERVRAGERAERVYGTADLASRFHAPVRAGLGARRRRRPA